MPTLKAIMRTKTVVVTPGVMARRTRQAFRVASSTRCVTHGLPSRCWS